MLNRFPVGQKRNKKEITDFLEFIENECTTYLNLSDTTKAVLRKIFIAQSTYIKTLEKSHTRVLTAHLKTLE